MGTPRIAVSFKPSATAGFDISLIRPYADCVPLIRTEKQKENLAKFLYDLAKIVLASAVIALVVNLSAFSYVTIFVGWIAALLLFSAAYTLDGKEIQA